MLSVRNLVSATAAVGFLALLFLSSPPGRENIELEDLPNPVKSLEALSRSLVKRDESPAFKAAVLTGKQNQFLSSKFGQTLLPKQTAKKHDEGTIALAKTVAKLFPASVIKKLASKKEFKSGAAMLKTTASTIESKEELGALEETLKRDRATESKFQKSEAKVLAQNQKDRHELLQLALAIHKDRQELMQFGGSDEKKAHSKASVKAEAAVLESEAKAKDKKATELLKKAHVLQQGSRSAGLTANEKKYLKMNHKVLAEYRKEKGELVKEQKAEAHLLKSATAARAKALKDMHKAGALLSLADSHSATTAKAKKGLLKIREESGSLTRTAVELLMGSRAAKKTSMQLKHKIQNLEVKLHSEKGKVDAVKLSDKILKNPDLLRHPAEYGSVSEAEQRRKNYMAQALNLQKLAKAEKLKAESLIGGSTTAKKEVEHMSSTTLNALKTQVADAKAKAVRKQRREEEALARQLGNQMSKREVLKQKIKARAAALKRVESAKNSVARRTQFEEAVIARMEEQKK